MEPQRRELGCSNNRKITKKRLEIRRMESEVENRNTVEVWNNEPYSLENGFKMGLGFHYEICAIGAAKHLCGGLGARKQEPSPEFSATKRTISPISTDLSDRNPWKAAATCEIIRAFGSREIAITILGA
jgi:hypothetical protein